MYRCRRYSSQDDYRNVVESSSAVTWNVVRKLVALYVMSLENVLNVHRVLTEYSRAKDGSLRDAELQRDVRLALASVYHLSPVVEELRQQAESTAVNSEPSFEHVHEVSKAADRSSRTMAPHHCDRGQTQ